MAACLLLKDANADTVGQEAAMRVVGNREPPGRMGVQIAVTGSANVQLQGRIARDAPWLDMGPCHSRSALMHIEPTQFLRAVVNQVGAGSTVSVWAVWGF